MGGQPNQVLNSNSLCHSAVLQGVRLFQCVSGTILFVCACRARVCIHSSSGARSWECRQSSVDRPRTQDAYKCGPSVRLLWRFQFANLDRLVSAALIVLPIREKRKMYRCTFTLEAQTGPPGLRNRRSLEGSRRLPTSSSFHCGLCDCFARGNRSSGIRG